MTEEATRMLAVAYLAVVVLAIALSLRSASRVLKILKTSLPPQKWEEIGAPASLLQISQASLQAWGTFMRNRAYREHCQPRAVEAIERERRRVVRVFGVAFATGVVFVILVSQ